MLFPPDRQCSSVQRTSFDLESLRKNARSSVSLMDLLLPSKPKRLPFSPSYREAFRLCSLPQKCIPLETRCLAKAVAMLNT